MLDRLQERACMLQASKPALWLIPDCIALRMHACRVQFIQLQISCVRVSVCLSACPSVVSDAVWSMCAVVIVITTDSCHSRIWRHRQRWRILKVRALHMSSYRYSHRWVRAFSLSLQYILQPVGLLLVFVCPFCVCYILSYLLVKSVLCIVYDFVAHSWLHAFWGRCNQEFILYKTKKPSCRKDSLPYWLSVTFKTLSHNISVTDRRRR